MNNIAGYGLVIRFFNQAGDSYLALEDVCHTSSDAALADAFRFLDDEQSSVKKEHRVVGIFAMDGHGNTETYLNRNGIINARDTAEALAWKAESEDRKYGSYIEQHSQKISDVIGH